MSDVGLWLCPWCHVSGIMHFWRCRGTYRVHTAPFTKIMLCVWRHEFVSSYTYLLRPVSVTSWISDVMMPRRRGIQEHMLGTRCIRIMSSICDAVCLVSCIYIVNPAGESWHDVMMLVNRLSIAWRHTHTPSSHHDVNTGGVRCSWYHVFLTSWIHDFSDAWIRGKFVFGVPFPVI